MKEEIDTILVEGKNYLEDGVTLLMDWYLRHNMEQNLPEFYECFSKLTKRFVDVKILELLDHE